MAWHKANEKFNSLITQMFQAEEWQKRAEAAREIGLMKDGRATNLLCRALVKEEEHDVVNKIVEAIGRIGDKKATMKVVEKLKEELDKFEGDKYRLIYIIESLKNLKDKRALPYLSPFLNSPDEKLKRLTIEAFDAIQPNWREIIKNKQQRSVKEIFENEKKKVIRFGY